MSWDGLSRGKFHHLKAELVRLLQLSAPSQATAIYDAFRLEQQGKLIGCCVRISVSSLPHVLALSGKEWLFVHPLATQAADYPAIWTGEAWPTSLGPLYARSQDAGAMSLILGDRHIGFRVSKAHEAHARQALGSVPKESWYLNGVPLSYSGEEAQGLLADMGAEGKILEQSRRVARNTQSWTVHLRPDTRPSEDTLYVQQGGKDFFHHLNTRHC